MGLNLEVSSISGSFCYISTGSRIICGNCFPQFDKQCSYDVSSFKLIWDHYSSNIGMSSCSPIWINVPLNDVETSGSIVHL